MATRPVTPSLLASHQLAAYDLSNPSTAQAWAYCMQEAIRLVLFKTRLDIGHRLS